MLRRVFGFPTDAKVAWQSESVACAVVNTDSVGIFAFSLLVMTAKKRASKIKGTMRPPVSFMVFSLDLTIKGAHARDFGSVVRSETSSSNSARSSPLFIILDSASANWCLMPARSRISNSNSNSLSHQRANLPVTRAAVRNHRSAS